MASTTGAKAASPSAAGNAGICLIWWNSTTTVSASIRASRMRKANSTGSGAMTKSHGLRIRRGNIVPTGCNMHGTGCEKRTPMVSCKCLRAAQRGHRIRDGTMPTPPVPPSQPGLVTKMGSAPSGRLTPPSPILPPRLRDRNEPVTRPGGTAPSCRVSTGWRAATSNGKPSPLSGMFLISDFQS